MVRDETGIYGDSVYCIPLESVGLGGNQITCTGVASLADGLKSNTRKYPVTCWSLPEDMPPGGIQAGCGIVNCHVKESLHNSWLPVI